jgi:mercuric ion binding protein
MSLIRVLSLFAISGIFGGAPLAEERTVTLSVPDMTCPSCVTGVKRALSRIDGVHKVEMNPTALLAVVTFDDTRTNPEALVDVTGIAGYPANIKR